MVSGGSKRRYEETHPWITFTFNANQLDHQIWLMLGEAVSKSTHIIGTPLLPHIHQKLMSVFLAKGAFATTSIEGNTLTEEEVEKRIEGNLKLPPSQEYLGQEVDNIVKAYNLIGQSQIDGGSDQLTVEEIREFNRLVLEDLPLEEEIKPGETRNYQVEVARYRGAPAEDCDFLLSKYVAWLNEAFTLPKGEEMIWGVLKAIIAHVYFEWIHPFGDGNGRTGRLIEFRILLSAGFPATTAHLLSNHYNQTRSEYYRHLEMASSMDGDLRPFLKYALTGFVDQLRIQIDMIKQQQLFTHWVNFVHETFKGRERTQDKRRRRLILDMGEKSRNDRTPIENVRHVSPRVAEAYADLTERTLDRDLVRLMEMGLLVEAGNGYLPNWEILQAFMPSTKEN